MYVYAKRADTWHCRRCKFANPLMDDYHFITECQACSDEMRSRFGLNDGERISGRRSRSPRPVPVRVGPPGHTQPWSPDRAKALRT